MRYEPAPTPSRPESIPEFLGREFRRIAAALKDPVSYLTGAETGLLSAGVSANWKAPAGNIVRVSTSNTVTITGIADTTPNRLRTFINIGTGVVVFKNEGTESSAQFRLAIPANWQLSAGASATLWYDAVSARHRGLNRT